MQLTIDSHEPLADVLRAVGGLYGVTLTTSTTPAAETSGGDAQAGRRSATPRARRGKSKSTSPDPKAVRAWAIEHGYSVNPRGSLSAEVREAFAANGS